MAENQNHFCSCLTAGSLTQDDLNRLRGHRAALLLSSKWTVGNIITVRFLEGAPALQQRVRAGRRGMDEAREPYVRLPQQRADGHPDCVRPGQRLVVLPWHYVPAYSRAASRR